MKSYLNHLWPVVLLGISLALPLAAATEVARKPDLHPVDGAALKKAIAAQRGKVLLVNLWATWCPPCVEEFPDLVKLDDNLRAKGLVVLGVSMDEPHEIDKVQSFLAEQKARFPVYIRSSGDIDNFFDPVDKKWTGAVPTTYVFDRKGKLVGKPMVGAQSRKTLADVVQPLLK